MLDQVDFFFLQDLASAWEDWPPLRKFAASYFGHKPKAKASRDYSQLVAMFPGGKIG